MVEYSLQTSPAEAADDDGIFIISTPNDAVTAPDNAVTVSKDAADAPPVDAASLPHEGFAADGLLLGLLRFRPSAIQDFEEVVGLGAHARVNVGLGAFDVVVEIISQRVDEVDRVVPRVGARVTRIKDESDVTDIVTDGSVGA